MTRLMEHRGLIDGPAARMCRFLADTDTVEEGGLVADVPAMIGAYAARSRVSRVTAWTDLRRLADAGLIVQVRAAAPGQRAAYRLTFTGPAAAAVTGLPTDLARAITPRSRPLEPVENPPAEGAEDDASCGQLNPSPLTREGSPPSPDGTGTSGPAAAPRTAPQERRKGTNNHAAALIAACRSEWAAQRGWGRVPGAAELARVERLTTIALRSVPPGEVLQMLTWHTATAADLPSVLCWRLGRAIGAARGSARPVPVDENGSRHAAMLAARRPGLPSAGSAAAEALAAARAHLGPARRAARPDQGAIAASQAAESRARRLFRVAA